MTARSPLLPLYIGAVCSAGAWLTGALVLTPSFLAPMQDRPATYLLLVALLFCGELFPVRILRIEGAGSVTVSMPFLITIMVLFEPGAALVPLLGASLAADLKLRRPLEAVAFNLGQYAIGLAAAASVQQHVGAAMGTNYAVSAEHLAIVVLMGTTYFLVCIALTAGVVTLASGQPVRGVLRGFAGEAVTGLTLVLVAAIVLVVAEHSAYLLPVLILPAAAVHRSVRISAEKEHESLHDPLTGLPNRRLFHSRVEQALRTRAGGGGDGIAVMLIDLDHFKEINDTLGHGIGDQLLLHVGDRLVGVAGETATVARLGGDEYAILLPQVPSTRHATEVAKAILASLEQPFVMDHYPLTVDASIGISVTPEHGDVVETLLRCADVAMYVAKEQRSGVEVYDAGRDQHSRRRLALLGELRPAIEAGQLVCFYQPKADARTGAVVGVEALVRWQHPVHGLLPPSEFIPMAERTVHVGAITHCVLGQALEQWTIWRDLGIDLTVSVNLPLQNLRDADFVDRVLRELGRVGMPPSQLEFEITETSIMTDPDRTLRAFHHLRGLGVRLAVDDFGTGYSSLSYLRHLPVDTLKIDRSFVRGLAQEAGDQVIVRSTVDLARNLHLDTVAEGVEDVQTWALLEGLGCRYIQGYILSPPISGPALTQWMLARLGRSAPGVGPVEGPNVVAAGTGIAAIDRAS
jgi:diguanylate cyclase (GGDEF)-like protein